MAFTTKVSAVYITADADGVNVTLYDHKENLTAATTMNEVVVLTKQVPSCQSGVPVLP